MLELWGLPVAEVERVTVGKEPYGGDIDGGGDEINEGEALDVADESDRDTGTGTTDPVISAA